MSVLPRRARIYVFIIIALGVLSALFPLSAVLETPSLVIPTVALAAVIAVLDLYPVHLPIRPIEITVSTSVKTAATILLPLPVLLLGVYLGTAIGEWRMKRVWYKLAFNASVMTLTYTAAAWVYYSLRDNNVGLLGSLQNVFALVALAVTELVVNSVLISLIVAFQSRLPLFYVWSENYRPVVWHDLSMLPIGVLIAIFWQIQPWSVLLAVAPLLVAHHSYKMASDLRDQTRAALQALAQVLDERDNATLHHCERVAQYAEAIARELHLSADEVDVIARAAWLHDIGKVGMRNDILFKPGALAPEEREEAKRHAIIGGELLKKFPLFETGAVYVRYHHERWDGSGYPDGLRGDKIPLGARILAVADSFQAMTDARPYRAPLSKETAMAELRAGSGTQFDPQVVEAFFRSRARESDEPVQTIESVPGKIPVVAE